MNFWELFLFTHFWSKNSHHVFIQLSHDLDVQNSIKHPNVQKKKVKTSITFFVCLGLKRAEKKFKKKFKRKKKIFIKVLFLAETRAKKFWPKIFFFIRATPLKNGNFSKKKFLHLLILKIFTLSKFHSPIFASLASKMICVYVVSSNTTYWDINVFFLNTR